MKDWRHKLLMAVGPTAGIGLFFAFAMGWWLLPEPVLRAWGYLLACFVTVLAVCLELVFGLGRKNAETIRLCLPPVMLVTATAAFLLLAETMPGKAVVYLVGVLLVSSYQSHLMEPTRQEDGQKRLTESGPDLPLSGEVGGLLESRPGLPQAAFITDLLTVFFLTSFVFGLGVFYDVPMLTVSVVIGLIWGVVAHENFWRFGFGTHDRRLLSAVFVLVGTEIGFGMSILPVAYLTKSATVVLLLAFGLHLTRQIVMGTVQPKQFRGQVIAVIALIILLFITTKWH